MKLFTILLLRPDYQADNYGQDTYMTHAKGNDWEEALKLAQVEACEVDGVDPDDFDDYYPLAVISGKHASHV
jgi:hypothetical protein